MNAYLFLENGRRFAGSAFGFEGEAIGTLSFNTSAISSMELLSDPVSAGAIVLQTFPMAGNYGVIREDLRGGKVCCAGYVCREWCEEPSNFRCGGTLDELLKEFKVPGICGIDTRELTRVLRESGSMNAMITAKASLSADELKALKAYKPACPAEKVGVREVSFTGKDEGAKSIGVLDFGAGDICEKELFERGFGVYLIPYDYSLTDMAALDLDGLVVSDGPGSAADYPEAKKNLQALFGEMPIFGVGLGHEVLAEALGGKCEAMTHEHRGANQPVREIATGRVRITTQNHGSAVAKLPQGGEVTFVSEHDGSVEGIEYKDKNAFSVQFTPLTDGGVNDQAYIWDNFAAMVSGGDR